MKFCFASAAKYIVALCFTGTTITTCSTAHADSNISEAKLKRLINISATYFDLPPFGEPAWGNRSIEPRFLFSFLPSIEELDLSKDMPPVHAIPSLNLNHRLTYGERWALRGSSVMAAVIPGSEKLIGVKSTPRQWLFNLGTTLEWRFNDFDAYAQLQAQYVNTIVSGVEHPLPSTILTTSKVTFATIGARSSRLPFWGSFSIGAKQTHIEISTQNRTILHYTDSLGDSPFPFIAEVAMGWWQKDWNLHVGIGEVFIPERLYMPRIFVGYLYEFENFK